MLDSYFRTLLVVLCTGLSLNLVTPVASSEIATLSVTVIDSTGAVIPNSSVIVHWDSAGLDGVKDNIGTKEDKVAATDATGSFSLEIRPGVYDVFVAAAGFSPHCEKLTIKPREIHPYRVQLDVSRMTTIVIVD
jgi:Carboxypeptidase regulatory-like domain